MERLGLKYCLQVTIETYWAAKPKTLHSCFMGRLGNLEMGRLGRLPVVAIGKFRKQYFVNPLLVDTRRSLSNLSSFKQIEKNIQI
jgi:hypothetical protein